MPLSTLRLVKNQILFREVNERVRETVLSSDGRVEFLCECGREGCLETLPLELAEYERIRCYPNLFLIVPGHERIEVEQVVERLDGYTLIAKILDAKRAVASDPRSREAVR